jgi:hypothetical protein
MANFCWRNAKNVYFCLQFSLIMSKVVKSQKVYKVELFGREQPEGPAEEREPWLYISYDYDSGGNLVQEISYTADGEMEQITKFAFDQHGKLCEERFEQAGDEFTEWREYVRDENGIMQKEIHHFLDGSCDIVTYSYDSDGKLLKKTVTDDEDEPEREEHFIYENDLLVGEKVVDNEGEVLATQKYAYHPNGKLMSHELITQDGRNSVNSVHFYDESGNKIKSLLYNTEGQLIEISKWQYDEKGSLVKSEEETQNKHNLTTYEFDHDSKILRQTETDADGLVLSKITRRFDEEGRVLESHVFSEATPQQPLQDYLLKYDYEFYAK